MLHVCSAWMTGWTLLCNMKMKWSACHERGTKKKSESQTGFEPMTSQTPGGHSTHLSHMGSYVVKKLLVQYTAINKYFMNKIAAWIYKHHRQEGIIKLCTFRKCKEWIHITKRTSFKASYLKVSCYKIYILSFTFYFSKWDTCKK